MLGCHPGCHLCCALLRAASGSLKAAGLACFMHAYPSVGGVPEIGDTRGQGARHPSPSLVLQAASRTHGGVGMERLVYFTQVPAARPELGPAGRGLCE